MASTGPPPSAASPNRQTLRIQRDLQAIRDNQLSFIRNPELSVETIDETNLNVLTGIMAGPEGSAYAGGHFRFKITFPPEYPFKPPDFVFITAICHPNVHSGGGLACHDQLNATWAPSVTLAKLLTEMHQLLAQPNYDTPMEGDSVSDKNPEKARRWTHQFAQPPIELQ
jgi:ubiquitin-protein ligase